MARPRTVLSKRQPLFSTTEHTSAEHEAAAVLTDFMAKAHEEKIRAMARVEAKYKDRIEELEAKVAELEGPQIGKTATSANSYAFPATNKLLTDMVRSYRAFISDYLVKANIEKQKAVQAAEAKVTAKYEAVIEKYEKIIESYQNNIQ